VSAARIALAPRRTARLAVLLAFLTARRTLTLATTRFAARLARDIVPRTLARRTALLTRRLTDIFLAVRRTRALTVALLTRRFAFLTARLFAITISFLSSRWGTRP
jgi:hypothetical protein